MSPVKINGVDSVNDDEYEMELIALVNGEEEMVFYVYFDTYSMGEYGIHFYNAGRDSFYTADEEFIAAFLKDYSDCE